jgi:hypothetical protein
VPLVRHPPGTPGNGVEVGVITGVGVGVFGGGLPAALTVLEGMFSKANTITPMTRILKILILRVMIFSPYLNRDWRLARKL